MFATKRNRQRQKNCAMTKIIRILAIFWLTSLTAARAEPIALICGGVTHHYKPEKMDGTVNPASAIIDLDNKFIETPVGDFAISKITPATIWFSRPSSESPNEGSIDRGTGMLKISWYSKEDAAKKAKGLPFFVELYVELLCTPTKRMF
jgi:hypothetical protein